MQNNLASTMVVEFSAIYQFWKRKLSILFFYSLSLAQDLHTISFFLEDHIYLFWPKTTFICLVPPSFFFLHFGHHTPHEISTLVYGIF